MQHYGTATVASGLAQGAGGLKRSGAPVDQFRRDVGSVAERFDRTAQFGVEGGWVGGQKAAQYFGGCFPVGQIGMAEGCGARRLYGGRVEAQARKKVGAFFDRKAQNVPDEARIQHGRGKGGGKLVALTQGEFDGFQFHIGETEVAQG
ncbi:hypothetical protein D3C85_1246730 [compost metagenome]